MISLVRARWWSYAVSLLLTMTLGYFLLRVPIQVSDSFSNMLVLDRPFGEVVRAGLQPGYFRPGLWAELKIVHDLSQGAYFYWFRWTQVVQVVMLVALFVRLVRPVTLAGAVVLPVGVAVLIGHHAFAWTVREAFPINTFLTIVLSCAAAAAVSFAPFRRWHDVAAVLLFIVAALTVESGLLVGVILIGAYAAGLRGVSRAGILAVGALGVGYLVLRFGVLDIGTPSLLDRDAGFGFQRYDARDLQRMFGERPFPFYAYNVVSAVVGLLFAEPRDGAWVVTRGAIAQNVPAPLIIGLVSSTLATSLIARFVWVRRRAWLRRTFDTSDRIVLLFLLVLGANAAISYTYTKDVIMSPAGYFYAAAFVVACRDYVDHLSLDGTPWRRAIGAAILLVMACTWTVRAVGLHAALTRTAYKVREQWAYVDESIERMGYVPVPPSVARLKERLQTEAVITHPGRPQVRERWTWLFEMD